MVPAQPMSQSVHRQWRSHCMGQVMDRYVAGMDTSVTSKGPTQDHEDALDGVKEDLRQEVVHHALVLGEAVEDAAAGVGVEEGQGRPQDVARHLLVHQRRRAAQHTAGAQQRRWKICCAVTMSWLPDRCLYSHACMVHMLSQQAD